MTDAYMFKLQEAAAAGVTLAPGSKDSESLMNAVAVKLNLVNARAYRHLGSR